MDVLFLLLRAQSGLKVRTFERYFGGVMLPYFLNSAVNTYVIAFLSYVIGNFETNFIAFFEIYLL